MKVPNAFRFASFIFKPFLAISSGCWWQKTTFGRKAIEAEKATKKRSPSSKTQRKWWHCSEAGRNEIWQGSLWCNLIEKMLAKQLCPVLIFLAQKEVWDMKSRNYSLPLLVYCARQRRISAPSCLAIFEF